LDGGLVVSRPIISCQTSYSLISIALITKNIHLSTVFIGDFTINAVDHCDPNPAYPRYLFFFRRIWPWIDLVIFALLPLFIVTISNSLILYDRYQRRIQFGYRNLDRSLMKFLLINSVSFICCNCPIATIIVLYPYISRTYDKNGEYDRIAFLFDMLRLVSYTALALNFYFYYYSSSIFRQQAANLFNSVACRRWHTNKISDESNSMHRLRTRQSSESTEVCNHH
jgi:hypothetical protein